MTAADKIIAKLDALTPEQLTGDSKEVAQLTIDIRSAAESIAQKATFDIEKVCALEHRRAARGTRHETRLLVRLCLGVAPCKFQAVLCCCCVPADTWPYKHALWPTHVCIHNTYI